MSQSLGTPYHQLGISARPHNRQSAYIARELEHVTGAPAAITFTCPALAEVAASP